MEEAEHALWRAAGLSIHAPDADIGWPRVTASCDFHRALRFEQEFEVTVRVTEVTSRRTITYRVPPSHAATRTIATGRARRSPACSRDPTETMKSMDIPPDIAARFGESE